MTEVPRDLPILERDAVRVVVRDSEDRILLFHPQEITLPELGVWWELPGGGIDEGETDLDAAVRELREETGAPSTPAACPRCCGGSWTARRSTSRSSSGPERRRARS